MAASNSPGSSPSATWVEFGVGAMKANARTVGVPDRGDGDRDDARLAG